MILWKLFCQGEREDKKMDMNLFMKQLRKYKENLTKQQYKTLKGQAVAGDIVGANKGLRKIIQRGF